MKSIKKMTAHLMIAGGFALLDEDERLEASKALYMEAFNRKMQKALKPLRDELDVLMGNNIPRKEIEDELNSN